SDEEIEVDVRLIAATNQDLKQLVQDGKFREDLFYRLNVITINVPPLVERKDDIPILASAFLKRFREEMGKPNLVLSQGSYRLLLAYDWPGNVRELEHCLKGAVAMARGPLILPEDLNLSGDTSSKTLDTSALEHKEFPKLNPRERALLDYMLKGNTEITRSQYQAMADGLPSRTALYDLQHLVNLGILKKIGKGPATRYRLLDRTST
ncbi:MAG: sigma 54-interacting transcriptional regulator, partial [Desulfatiglandales bacterium]